MTERQDYDSWIHKQMGCEGPVPELPSYEEWLLSRPKESEFRLEMKLSDEYKMAKYALKRLEDWYFALDNPSKEDWNQYTEDRKKLYDLMAVETWKEFYDK